MRVNCRIAYTKHDFVELSLDPAEYTGLSHEDVANAVEDLVVQLAGSDVVLDEVDLLAAADDVLDQLAGNG